MNQTQPSSQEVPVAGPPEETQESQDPPWPSAQDNDHDRNEGEVSQGRENDGSDREVNQDRDNDGNDSDAKSLSSGSQSDDEGDVSGNEPPSDDEGSSDDSGSDSDGEDVEKHVPLTYQIPRETLRTAMKTSKSNVDGSSWSYTLYRGPNNEEIALHYCRNMEVAETVAKYFLDEQVLGFDIEWKPNASAAAGIKGNASLIQLASENRIALFHISLFKGTTAEELLPPTIKTILETPAILKTGVAVKSDFTRLKKFLGVEARGVFELSHLYKLVKFSKDEPEKVNRTLVSLANQVAEHLQLPLHKGAVRESDWSKPLLIEQMRYAASDAYAGVRLFDVLEAKRKKLRPTPPRPQCAELGLPIALAGGVKVRRVKSKMPVVVVEEEEESDEYESALEEQEVDISAVTKQIGRVNLSTTSPSTSATQHPPTSSPTSALELAAFWIDAWHNSLPMEYQPKATSGQLRAYALWHEQNLSVAEIAALLRDPPLAISTVSSYVLTAVMLEGLPYKEERIKVLLLAMPSRVVTARYRGILRGLGVEEVGELSGA
ncbi:ribonuclease H-like protein [Mytilinidion resinicola]|uniref:Ribonuclease H-like protein n=1 Tax=Mytilinidion resinicola TaxID=574789 RepID=A0A6A6Y671_9PEZI|nr:ribonuclease H-like protein [Mytilinidion resinicola]KAF2804321.1 ribonuclease H-like protein [Mytilinidion resinicola]